MIRKYLKVLMIKKPLKKITLIPKRISIIKTLSFNFAKKKKGKNANQNTEALDKEIPKEFDLTIVEDTFNGLKEGLREELNNYNIGKLTPDLFKNIYARVYNENTPLIDLGQIIPINANTVSFNIYDVSIKKEIFDALEKDVINDFDLQLKSDDVIVISTINSNTKEKKIKLVKFLREILNKYLKLLKSKRHDFLKDYNQYKNSISEDLLFNIIKEVDTMNKNTAKAMHEIYDQKGQDIMN